MTIIELNKETREEEVVSLEECIKRTEECWNKEDVKKRIENGLSVFNPFCHYYIKESI